MATAESVKMKIQGLISSANAATGETSGDLSSAVEKLIAGYGSSGAALHTGVYVTSVRSVEDIEFSTPGGASYFVMFMQDVPQTGTGAAFLTSVSACKETGRVVTACSNSSGSMSTAANVYPTGEPSLGNFPGVSFGENSITLIAYKPLSNTVRLPQENKNYVWMAW